MDFSTVNLETDDMGGQPITDLSVNNKDAKEDVIQEIQSSQESLPNKSEKQDEKIPYYRFKEVNDEKNELKVEKEILKQKLSDYETRLQSLEKQPASEKEEKENLDFNNVSELITHVKEKIVRKELEDVMKNIVEPLKKTTLVNTYKSNLQSYFSSNPEAAKIKKDMDSYVTSWPAERKDMLVKSVVSGDTTSLDEIYYTVSARNTKNTDQVVLDTKKSNTIGVNLGVPNNGIAKDSGEAAKMISEAKKTGDFSAIFRTMADNL